MQLTQEQAVRLARVAALAMGIDSESRINRQADEMTEAERGQAVTFAEAILRDAIAQGLVVEAAPVKPFVDLRTV